MATVELGEPVNQPHPDFKWIKLRMDIAYSSWTYFPFMLATGYVVWATDNPVSYMFFGASISAWVLSFTTMRTAKKPYIRKLISLTHAEKNSVKSVLQVLVRKSKRHRKVVEFMDGGRRHSIPVFLSKYTGPLNTPFDAEMSVNPKNGLPVMFNFKSYGRVWTPGWTSNLDMQAVSHRPSSSVADVGTKSRQA